MARLSIKSIRLAALTSAALWASGCSMLIVPAGLPSAGRVGGPPTQLGTFGLESVQTAACAPIDVALLDVDSLEATVTVPTILTVSATGRGNLYSNIDCTIPLTSVNIGPDTVSRRTIYYQNFGVEPVLVSVAVADASLPTQSFPLTLTPGITGLAIGTSSNTTFMIASGSLYGVGRNSNYLLSDGTQTQRNYAKVITGIGGKVKQVAASGGFYNGTTNHVCVVLETGDVKCWGRNAYGQLGTGNKTNLTSPPTEPIDLGGSAIMVDTGKLHTCALLEGGTVKCWGFNYQNQLGPGNNEILEPPTSGLDLGGEAIKIETGDEHSCALLRTGDIKCWGRNNSGQIGAGMVPSYDTSGCEGVEDCYGEPVNQYFPNPTAVVNLGEMATDLSVGIDFSCAVLSSGDVKCWGRNDTKNLGIGTTVDQVSPVTVLNLGQPAVSVYAGNGNACAILEDRSLKCWGNNASYQSNPLSASGGSIVATTVSLPDPVAAVVLGEYHMCALTEAHRTYCWGAASFGQLGTGITVSSATAPGEVIVPYVRIALDLTTPSSSIPFLCNSVTATLKQETTNYLAPHDLTLSLNDETEEGSFYSDAACTQPITTVGVSNGQSSASAYYRTTSAVSAPTSLQLTANITEGGGASPGKLSTVAAGPVAKPVYYGSNLVDPQTCTMVSVKLTDIANNLNVYPTSLIVSLSGGGYGSFHATASCNEPITSVAIPAGSTSSANFYYLSGAYDEDALLGLQIGGVGSLMQYLVYIGCGAAGCGG